MERAKNDIINPRTIVSKNCTFIDERGRLVQKDLVIKGQQAYGAPGYDTSDQSIMDRMRRSREDRRKRSTSREKNKLSRKVSREESESDYNNDNSSYASSSFYQNSSYRQNANNPLKEFIRPVK